MLLDHRPPIVITGRGEKKVRYRVAGRKEQITIVGCINAIAQSIPMVIFEEKYLNHQRTVGKVSGTYYGMSGKGWTDQELCNSSFIVSPLITSPSHQLKQQASLPLVL